MSTRIILYTILLVVSLNAVASSTWVDNRYAQKNQYKIGGQGITELHKQPYNKLHAKQGIRATLSLAAGKTS